MMCGVYNTFKIVPYDDENILPCMIIPINNDCISRDVIADMKSIGIIYNNGIALMPYDENNFIIGVEDDGCIYFDNNPMPNYWVPYLKDIFNDYVIQIGYFVAT